MLTETSHQEDLAFCCILCKVVNKDSCLDVASRTAPLLSSFWLGPSLFLLDLSYSFWLFLYWKHGEGVTAKGVTAFFWDISSVFNHLPPCQWKHVIERIWISVAYSARSSTRICISTLHQGQLPVLEYLPLCQWKQVIERIWLSVAYSARSSTIVPKSTSLQGWLPFLIIWSLPNFLLKLTVALFLFVFDWQSPAFSSFSCWFLKLFDSILSCSGYFVLDYFPDIFCPSIIVWFQLFLFNINIVWSLLALSYLPFHCWSNWI